MLTAPRPEFLATAGESALLARIDDLRRRVEEANRPDSEELMRRIDRLHGRLIWTLRTEYHERLTKLDASLRELRDATDVLERQYRQFVRVRQAATHSYAGYEKPIHRLRARVVSALAEVDRLMARQGHVIEVVAIDELESRRERLYAYQDKARYALADSYDRATQAQARRVESR
jgi:chromosome segregation ATPase